MQRDAHIQAQHDQSDRPAAPRSRWTGLAMLLVVAVSAGISPSAMALAFVPQVEHVWAGLARESCPDRTSVRQLQDAFAKAVRNLLKGAPGHDAVASVPVATSRPSPTAQRTLQRPEWGDQLLRSTLGEGAPGLLPQPPPAA